jgi:hypothetical protein
VVVALALPAIAEADTKTVRDGDDVANALDIRSVSQGHSGTRLTHTLRTYGHFAGRFLNGDNAIGFGFDTNRTASSLERFVVVFWANGALRAVVVNGKGNFIASAGVSRPDARSVRVRISRRSLGSPAGYRWFGFTIVGSRGDAAPNRGLILHDITAPTINFPQPPIPAATSYEITFSVSDRGGAGLKSWRLQQRDFGTTSWSTIASGTAGGSKAVSVSAAEGDDDQYRVVAVDRQSNTRLSAIRTVSVPVDDGDPSIVYAGGWSTANAVPDAFLGTLHTSSTSGDSLTYTFDGRYVAVVGPADCGTVTVTVDGVQWTVSAPCTGAQRRVLYSESLPGGTHTLSVEPFSGSFSLDGIVSR